MKTCPQCQVKYPDALDLCPRDGSALPAAQKIEADRSDPLIGTTIDGRYAIEARLGEGGMGVVYRAKHVLIDKPVAIKILRKEAAQDTAAVQRFIQEARSASRIGHSNIVDITDFGVLPDGHAYFVMEFLQGPTLAQVLQDGPLDPIRVCHIAAQMARGLHAAHQKGIVHRDLKPENVFLLDREGQKDFVKIVDFGIAKVGSGQRLTQVGMVLGTPEYMSPEQATGSETDHRVDQYALGCMMYEMLTGVVPFLCERPAQTLTKHVFEPVIPPRQRKPELNIPPSLEAVVMRTLAKKPTERFPSMRELETALQQVEAELRSGRVVVDERHLQGSGRHVVQAASPPPADWVASPTQTLPQQGYPPGYLPPSQHSAPGLANAPAPASVSSPASYAAYPPPGAVPAVSSGSLPPAPMPYPSGFLYVPAASARPMDVHQTRKTSLRRSFVAALVVGLVLLLGGSYLLWSEQQAPPRGPRPSSLPPRRLLSRRRLPRPPVPPRLLRRRCPSASSSWSARPRAGPTSISTARRWGRRRWRSTSSEAQPSRLSCARADTGLITSSWWPASTRS